MIRRIKDRDFFMIPDRFGRFHSNLSDLKKTLRPFLVIETPAYATWTLQTDNL